VDVTGYLDKGIASLRAHDAYMKGLGDTGFDAGEFLTWIAAASGARLEVDYAVLFEVYELISDEAPPWAS
jgi:hypothetical protein